MLSSELICLGDCTGLRDPARPWEHGRMLQATSLGDLPELMDFGFVEPRISMEVGDVETELPVMSAMLIGHAAVGGAIAAAFASKRWGTAAGVIAGVIAGGVAGFGGFLLAHKAGRL